jgi:hypothetical protein
MPGAAHMFTLKRMIITMPADMAAVVKGEVKDGD